MELGALTVWLEEIDALYLEINSGPEALHLLGYQLLRDYVWPLLNRD